MSPPRPSRSTSSTRPHRRSFLPAIQASTRQATDGSDRHDQGPITAFVFGAHVGRHRRCPIRSVTTDSPPFFPVGTTTVTFTAIDASGNKATAKAKLTVVPKPAPGTTPPHLPPPSDNTPPANVSGVQARVGDGRIIMKWTNPTDSDFDHVEITRTNGTGPTGTRRVVYSGEGDDAIPTEGFRTTRKCAT